MQQNRLCSKNHATGNTFLSKIMRQGIIIDEKLCDRVFMERIICRGLLEQLIMHTFGKNLMQQGILLGHFYGTGYRVCRGFHTSPSLP